VISVTSVQLNNTRVLEKRLEYQTQKQVQKNTIHTDKIASVIHTIENKYNKKGHTNFITLSN